MRSLVNDHPIHIEIGMGKGRFLHTLAKQNPQINYVGIEKYSSVLLRAIQKMEEDELPNLKFIRMDAEDIDKVFGKGEVDRIYLNFSDPWPKDRHAKRRLPSRQFLARYDVILKKEGTLEFKTDNRPLFDFAVEELEPAGWQAQVITYDLHNDAALMEGNVMTEYEEKVFLRWQSHLQIYYLQIRPQEYRILFLRYYQQQITERKDTYGIYVYRC